MILNHLWFGMDLLTASRRPRVHTQLLPDVVEVEGQTLLHGLNITAPEAVAQILSSRGHHNVSFVDASFGVSQFISVDYDSGSVTVQAVSDPRKDGHPAALHG